VGVKAEFGQRNLAHVARYKRQCPLSSAQAKIREGSQEGFFCGSARMHYSDERPRWLHGTEGRIFGMARLTRGGVHTCCRWTLDFLALATSESWSPIYTDAIYTVFRKKHPLTFSFISTRVMGGFKQKLQWMVDSDNVKIRYSLQPMTSLWRHIYKRL